MNRIVFVALVLAGLPLLGCGGGGAGTGGGGFEPLEAEFAVPLVAGSGEATTLGLRNLVDEDAPVTATVFDATGAPVALLPFLVPALGETQLVIPAPPTFGWIHVETRDTTTLATLPTTGRVIPYAQVEGSGPRGEYDPAVPFATTSAALPVGPNTSAVQFINNSRVLATPTTPSFHTFRLRYLDTDGDVVVDSGPLFVAANAAVFVPTPFPGFVGQFRADIDVDSPAVLELFTLATREEAAGISLGQVIDPGIARQSEDSSRFTELALEFGQAPAGDYRDFAFLVTNATDGEEVVQINEIRNAGGVSILPSARSFTLGPRESRYFATTLFNSVGLIPGEAHPFADLFGDPFLQTSLTTFRVGLVHGPGVVLVAPNFDPAFFSAYQDVPEQPRSFDSVICGVEQETTALGAERNWFAITNPTNSDATVFVKAYTPGGSEYLLPDLTVPALGRLDWSPDGIVLNGLVGIREDQNVPTDPPVPFLTWRLSSGTGLGVIPRREVRDVAGILLLVTPHVVRSLSD